MPAAEKLVSIFEVETDIICRNKAGKPTDDTQWKPAIDQHIEMFGKPPIQASADRGVWSTDNEAYATEKGVRHVVLPKAGYKSKDRRAHERQPWFRRGRRYHAGVEGRISVLKRKHDFGTCQYRGSSGFHRHIGLSILAANLSTIGRRLHWRDI